MIVFYRLLKSHSSLKRSFLKITYKKVNIYEN